MIYMDTETKISGKIIERQPGSKRYYYYSRSYRVKLDPEAEGKTKGSGKSRAVNEQTYLGTAEAVLHKLLDQKKLHDPVEVHKKEFGLPVALFEMAERIGLRDIIDQVVPGEVDGIAISDFFLIAAVNRVGNHTPKESMGKWHEKTLLPKIQRVKPGRLNSQSFRYAYDKLISEARIRQEKQARGLAPNEKLDIDELEAVIDDSKIEAIEKGLWANLLREFGFIPDAVLYDAANFYNFCRPETGNSLSQFGKSKDGRDDKRHAGLQSVKSMMDASRAYTALSTSMDSSVLAYWRRARSIIDFANSS